MLFLLTFLFVQQFLSNTKVSHQNPPVKSMSCLANKSLLEKVTGTFTLEISQFHQQNGWWNSWALKDILSQQSRWSEVSFFRWKRETRDYAMSGLLNNIYWRLKGQRVLTSEEDNLARMYHAKHSLWLTSSRVLRRSRSRRVSTQESVSIRFLMYLLSRLTVNTVLRFSWCLSISSNPVSQSAFNFEREWGCTGEIAI